MGHFQGDAEVYRPKGEVDGLRAHDPIPALGARLRAGGLLDDRRDGAIRAAATARVQAAYDFARASAYPDPVEAFDHVFV
jgi:pyruvate dehydrogenase E1 component alpha subunit